MHLYRDICLDALPTTAVFSPSTFLFNPQAYSEFMAFVNILNEAVKGKKITDDFPPSPIIDKLVKLIEDLSAWVDETPAIEQPQRFGNKAFRTWWEKIRDVREVYLGHF